MQNVLLFVLLTGGAAGADEQGGAVDCRGQLTLIAIKIGG